MNKTFLIFLMFVMLMMSIPLQAVQAQDQAQEVPHVYDSTLPIDAEVRAALDAWLIVENPSSAIYYVVTFAQPNGYDTLVSLAGFSDVYNGWSITGDADGVNHVVWLGSVRVMSNGTVDRLTDDVEQARGNGYDIASADFIPQFAPLRAGGGNDITFPLSPAGTFQFGILGVHAAGYDGSGSTGNMVAVDLVSGSDMGVNFSTSWIFASAAGTVEYVCEDENSTAIVVKSPNNDRFLYAHLIQNESLVLNTVFTARQRIGQMRSGTFGTPDEGCGWADQRSTQYHLHWGIEPANGVFRAESCVLTVSENIWKCGSKTVSVGGYITARGSDSFSVTDPYASPTMFDYLLVGVYNIYDMALVQQLPKKTSNFALARPILNSAAIVLRVVNVLIMGNLNLTPMIGLWILAIYWRLAFGMIWLVGAILRTIKMITF